jgi:hypothetical protein
MLDASPYKVAPEYHPKTLWEVPTHLCLDVCEPIFVLSPFLYELQTFKMLC